MRLVVRVTWLLPVLLGSTIPARAASVREDVATALSFEDRVACQRAIEEVRWRHRIWPKENPSPKPVLSEVMTADAIRAKVADSLAKSIAAERIFGHRITVPELQAEMERMARGTKDPVALREIFAALGNDPRRIAETLARATLADRLVREAYASDEALLEATASSPDPSFDSWWNRVKDSMGTEFAPATGSFSLVAIPSTGCVEDTWRPVKASDIPEVTLGHTAVWTGTEMIVWGGSSNSMDVNTGSRYTPATDSWTPISTGANTPFARSYHSAVWTGTEMIVWGGIMSLSATYLDTGGRYDPGTDTWLPMSTASVPTARRFHSAIWTGSRMIVWGGEPSPWNQLNTGGQYFPATDTWLPTSLDANAPSARTDHTAIWTGSKMIVWGGNSGGTWVATGGRYDPVSDTWAATSTGANTPVGRGDHTAVWTGSLMVVWGGIVPSLPCTNSGGRYDPIADSWSPTSTGTNVPECRTRHAAVWTGSKMVVWGGTDANVVGVNSGGRYDPQNDTWLATSTGTNVPIASTFDIPAVWTGSEMIVWEGPSTGGGGRYNPATNQWQRTSTERGNVPKGASAAAAVWTGSEVLLWGVPPDGIRATIWRYDPATDSWTPSSESGLPWRLRGSAVWTGTEVLVWGGSIYGGYQADGARYDPANDSWLTMPAFNRPSARDHHSAVWTGTEMIVWGGQDFNGSLNTGGRYAPASDSWLPTSLGANLPSARTSHTAVWTGAEMIVWGGGAAGGGSEVNSGGRYSPVSDSWIPTSVGTNVPTRRDTHTAVWTGEEMIVWGGYGSGGRASTGGRYDPGTDTWRATSTSAGVPAGRLGHGAIWTGKEMVVWGGNQAVGPARSGRRYDPALDAWTPTSEGAYVPFPRSYFSTAWMGTQMFVWGGSPGSTSSGGLYCARSCAFEPPTSRPALAVERNGGTIAHLTWPPAADSPAFDVVKGGLVTLLASGGGFSSSTTECLSNDNPSTSADDEALPASGDAFWYVVRPVGCGGNGTYDSDSSRQLAGRDAGIAASSGACP